MIDGMYVFDNVIHSYDMSDENLRPEVPDSRYSRDHMVGAYGTGRWASPEYLSRSWGPEDLHDLVFGDGLTDMAMAQAVPIYDWYKDWFAPVKAQYEMAVAYPDKVLFCGAVDPLLEGIPKALDNLDVQVKELGARSIKLYNGHVEGGWRCDDPEIAYPIYQRCLDLGVDVIQFHKGIPFGMQDMDSLRPVDLQKPARDFPDLKFIIHHLAWPYLHETVSIASRFPNIYLALSGTLALFFVAPRQLQEVMGRLLFEVGSSKLMWGSEAPLAGPPGPYLQSFLDFEIAEDLQEGYGFPQITREDKQKILAGTFADLMGMSDQVPETGRT